MGKIKPAADLTCVRKKGQSREKSPPAVGFEPHFYHHRPNILALTYELDIFSDVMVRDYLLFEYSVANIVINGRGWKPMDELGIFRRWTI